MIKKLKQNILDEMNKTVLGGEIGSYVGLVNNFRIVEKMGIVELIKHNIRIAKHYKKA